MDRRARTARKLLIVAERDGDTVSPERGVYLVDLTQTVTRAGRARARRRRTSPPSRRCARRARGCSRRSPTAVKAGRRRRVGRRASTATRRRSSTSTRSTSRSRATSSRPRTSSTPTSRSATRRSTSRSSTARNALGGQTANVVATLKGTVNPELVYVVSSHYDSVADRPGRRRRLVGHGGAARDGAHPGGAPAAGDDRLRVVHRRRGGPARQPRVRAPRRRRQGADRRRAQQRHDRLGERPPARQHDPLLEPRHPRHPARARRCSSRNLITYDALYYKSTDAAAYYEAYGDIVGGIGSYPVLEQPALPPVARPARDDQPSARHRGRRRRRRRR